MNSSKRNGFLGAAFCLLLALAAVASDIVAAAENGGIKRRADSTATGVDTIVLAHRILDRWQPVAEELGVGGTAWREIFATQLTRMDASALSLIDAARVDTRDAKAGYQRFLQAVRSALVQSYQLAASGKGNMKLASTTTDQAFIPIVPCRVVDTRNALGPISAGSTRNYQFYASSASANFGTSQGGAAGAAGTVCPGTVNPNNGAPSAAVATVTVVSPTAGGNFIAWGGASPAPPTSVLNWNNAGDIAANTTVIPAGGRVGTGPGGAIQDFAIAYNGPGGQAQVVVDVVGYMVENLATALNCVNLINIGAGTGNFPADTDLFLALPACTTGFSMIGAGCADEYVATQAMLKEVSPVSYSDCGWHNVSGVTLDQNAFHAESVCCRIPGR